MTATADRIRELIDLLEHRAQREMRVWALLLPGRDRWRLFAEYREYCREEQGILSFVQAARNQVSRTCDPGRRDLLARIDVVEERVRAAGAPVHRRYLEALCEPDVPLPLGSARFLRQRLVALSRLGERAGGRSGEGWARPLSDLARALSARAHDLPEFGPA